MLNYNIIANTIKETFNAKIISYSPLGNGASGFVYKLEIDQPPFVLAVKASKNKEFLSKEMSQIIFISDKVDIKFPKIYCSYMDGENNYMFMQYFDGTACSSKEFLCLPKGKRKHLANKMAENIINLQKIKGDKFGDLENPIYENWHDYYLPFANSVYAEAVELLKGGYIKENTVRVLKLALENYNKIFSEKIDKPTLLHGDYWAQNIIADKTLEVIGVVDPFNCMWCDGEYELFALNAIYGKKLPVLESFKEKFTVSKNFEVKNAFYILFSETHWVHVLKHNNNAYLRILCKNFLLHLKKHLKSNIQLL